MKEYRDLRVWQEAMNLAETAYGAAGTLPPAERFGLASQMQRAAPSIPSNIAEGNARRSERDFISYLRIAYGSACELQTQALLSRRMDLGNSDGMGDVIADVDSLRKQIAALIGSLKRAS